MAYARPLALLIAFFVTAWIWFFADEKWLVIFPLAAAVVIGLFPVLRRWRVHDRQRRRTLDGTAVDTTPPEQP